MAIQLPPSYQRIVAQLKNIEWRHYFLIRQLKSEMGMNLTEEVLLKADPQQHFKIGPFPLEDYPPGDEQAAQLVRLTALTLRSEAAFISSLFQNSGLDEKSLLELCSTASMDIGQTFASNLKNEGVTIGPGFSGMASAIEMTFFDGLPESTHSLVSIQKERVLQIERLLNPFLPAWNALNAPLSALETIQNATLFGFIRYFVPWAISEVSASANTPSYDRFSIQSSTGK